MKEIKVRLWNTTRDAADATQRAIHELLIERREVPSYAAIVRWCSRDAVLDGNAHVDAENWSTVIGIPDSAESYIRFALESQGYVREVKS